MRTKTILSIMLLALVSQTACTITPYQWQLIFFYLTGFLLTIFKMVFGFEV